MEPGISVHMAVSWSMTLVLEWEYSLCRELWCCGWDRGQIWTGVEQTKRGKDRVGIGKDRQVGGTERSKVVSQ